jgi:RNA 3'-phosphate cyclase
MIPAMFAEKEVRVTVTGGTDVAWSPTVDYLQHVTLPLLQKFGYEGEIKLLKRGYYPVGGGCVELTVEPAKMRKIELLSPGKIISIHGISHAHGSLEHAKVAERQMKAARHLLYNRFPDAGIRVLDEYNDADCPGSGITVWAQTENTILGANALGERGKRAEDVGREAAERLAAAVGADAAVDTHMCDQIIPYLALAGGVVRAGDISEHARTNAEVVKIFGYDLRIDESVIRARGGD